MERFLIALALIGGLASAYFLTLIFNWYGYGQRRARKKARFKRARLKEEE